MGGLGINAGMQAEPGLYLIDRFLAYSANAVKDSQGSEVPIPGLDMDARGNMLGVGLILKARNALLFSVAAGAPLASISVNSDLPQTPLDRSGLGDAFLQPLKIGWRATHFDAVASYAFYAPTGRFEPRRGGVGRGFWTHQLSLGGAVFPGRDRRWRASALASVDLNGWKRGIDIKRGNTIQVQGGAGFVARQVFVLGVAGFALWQISDDLGADVPDVLRGLRTRGFGLGPELDVMIVRNRLNAELRFEQELGARSRPQGKVFVAGLSCVAWQPRSKHPAQGEARRPR